MFQRLHHIAYRCRDAQRTVEFYTRVVGLKYVAGLMPPETRVAPSWPLNEPGQPPRKVVGEPADSIHIFFELGDGSYLAFFDVASEPDEPPDTSPWWVKHIAFETESLERLAAAKARLERHGVQVLGPKDHDFCQSIYFMDPDGHRLEITVRTEQADSWDKLAAEAPRKLAEWNERKRRKFGKTTKPLPLRVAAMPEDSKVVPAEKASSASAN
jgi:catechol 2,3-dioxygenase-like lactoylglutathione lyase family enzyme